MYDKSLEQLIDAVIADGIITAQERKVVYNKAASLGIDQDEIEIYLEGRLEQYKHAQTTKTYKRGELHKCPNCGATIGSFVGICSECGYEITGIEGNSNVQKLLTQVKEIKNGSRGILDEVLLGVSDKEAAHLIQNFPIPNTKEDFIEFGSLCIANINEDGVIGTAWKNKGKQLIVKGKMLFGNDPDIKHIISLLRNNIKKSNIKNTIIGLIAATILIVIGGGSWYYLLSSIDKAKDYSKDRLEQINKLPTPSVNNYLECFRNFSSIYWEEDTTGDYRSGYRAFSEAQQRYRELLKIALLKAGFSEEEIPDGIKLKVNNSHQGNSNKIKQESNKKNKENNNREKDIDGSIFINGKGEPVDISNNAEWY